MLGAEIIAKAPADGYSLLVANTNISINPSLYKALPYDTASAFAPVVIAIFVPNVLVVHEEVPVKSLQELIAFAKAQPGKLNYASASSGSFPHLAVEMFKMLAGVNMTHVPYKGAAPALSAILGKEVEVLSSDIPGALPHLKSGRLKAIAVTGGKRMRGFPDVPTLAESGVPGLALENVYGLYAPAGVNPAVLAVLNRSVTAAMHLPEVRDKLAIDGAEPAMPHTPAQFKAGYLAQFEQWDKFIKRSGIVLE